MPISQQCRKCLVVFDFENNSAVCPHKGFPRTVKCKVHNRVDCGHDECMEYINSQKPASAPHLIMRKERQA